jgi:hypothetical protein
MFLVYQQQVLLLTAHRSPVRRDRPGQWPHRQGEHRVADTVLMRWIGLVAAAQSDESKFDLSLNLTAGRGDRGPEGCFVRTFATRDYD